jgi:hypothetical protein
MHCNADFFLTNDVRLSVLPGPTALLLSELEF